VWQIDFTQLNLAVQGGAKYRFGAWGLGRVVPKKETPEAATVLAAKATRVAKAHHKPDTYAWFNAATNAEYASSKQDGADGAMLEFTSGGKFESVFNGKNAGWDKSSDINVQVFAHRAQ
jgi:hypothetical protein